MADKKISALPAASTPLAGSEVLPIVQSGTTVKVSVANLTAGRTTAMSLLDVENSAGGGLLGTFKSNWSTTKLSVVADGVTGSAVLDVSSLGNTLPYGFKVRANGTETLDVDTSGNVKATIGNLVVGTAGKGIDFSANTHAAGMTSELLNWYEEGDWTPSYSGWLVDPTTAYAKYTRVGRLVTLHYVAENGTAAAASGVIGGLPFTSNAQQGASVAMKDTSFNSPGVTAFATINPNSTNIQSMTAANFAGLYWAFSTTYMV